MKKWFLPTFINLRQVEEDSIHHGIKLIEKDSWQELQDSVNAFLILLESDVLPPFYLDSIDVGTYDTSILPPTRKYYAKIQLISLGDFPSPLPATP